MALGALKVTLVAEIWEFIKRFRLAQISIQRFGKIAKATVNLVRSSMGKLGLAALAMFAAMTVAVVLFRKELAPAIKLQEQMSSIATLMRSKVGEAYSYVDKWVRQFTDDVLRLSSAFGESTDSVTKGLYDILSATIPTADAINVLTVAMRAARAGLTTTAAATRAIITVLMSYNMSFNQAAKVSDIFFATIRVGITTFKELAPVIGRAAATAAAAGLSFEELMASIATMTRAGLDTGVAITSINQTLLQFFNPAEEAMLIADELGMTMDLTTLRTEGLLSMMEKLSDILPEQVGKMFRQMRALRGVNALIQQITGFQATYNVMLEAAGETQIAFAKRAQALQMSLDRVRESFRNLKKQAVTPFIPSVKSATDALADLLEVLGKGGMDTARLVANIVAAVTALSGIVGVALIATKIFAALGVSLSALVIIFAKFIAIGVLIGGVVAGVVYLEKKFGFLTKVLEGFVNVVTLGQVSLDELKEALGWVGNAVVSLLKKMRILREESWADQDAIDELSGSLKGLTEAIDSTVEPTDDVEERWKGVIDAFAKGAPMTSEIRKQLEALKETLSVTSIYSIETKEGLLELLEVVEKTGEVTESTKMDMLGLAESLRKNKGEGVTFSHMLAVILEDIAATGRVTDEWRDKLVEMYREMYNIKGVGNDQKEIMTSIMKVLLSVGSAADVAREKMAEMTEAFIQERARIARLRAAFQILGAVMPEEIETAKRRIAIAFDTIFKDGQYTTKQLTAVWVDAFIPKILEAFGTIAPAYRKTTEELLGYTWKVVEAFTRLEIKLPTVEVAEIRKQYEDLLEIIKEGSITAGTAFETLFSTTEMQEQFDEFIERVRYHYGFIPEEYRELVEIMSGISLEALNDIKTLGMEAPELLENAAIEAYNAFMRLSEASKALKEDYMGVVRMGEEFVLAPDVEKLKQMWAVVEEAMISAYGALPDYAQGVYDDLIGKWETYAEDLTDDIADLVEQQKLGLDDYAYANYKMIAELLPKWRMYLDQVLRMEDITKEQRIQMLEDFLVELDNAGASWTDFAEQVRRALEALQESYKRTTRAIIEDVVTAWRREFATLLEEDILNWKGHSQKSMDLVREEMTARKRDLRDALLEGKITTQRYYAELSELDRQHTEEKEKRVKGFAKLTQDIWGSMQKFWVKLLAEMLAEFVANKLKELALSLLITKKKIAADQAETAGKAVKSAAGIPWPFNIIAIGAAVAAILAIFKNATKLAEGGIATRPIVGMIGEAGPEAVIPLGSPRAASALAGLGGVSLHFQDTFVIQGPSMIDSQEGWDKVYKDQILPSKRRHLEELRDISKEQIE